MSKIMRIQVIPEKTEPNYNQTLVTNQIERLNKAKNDIKTSIISKGGIVSDAALIGDYADIIKNLEDLFSIGNHNYKVAPVDEAGLKEIGWGNDDINYLKYNTLIPKGEDVGDRFVVSDANKQIVINSKSDIATYKDNVDFKFCPKFDTSAETNMSNMFSDCKTLTTIPLLNTANVTSMSSMFSHCTSLTSIPQFDTSKVTNMMMMFYNCSSLTSIPLLDTSKIVNTMYMFSKCGKLTTLGGFTGLNVDLDLSPCPLLTKESILNVFNKAANVTSSPKTLTLGTTNLSKLTDTEKAIATRKGWVLN